MLEELDLILNKDGIITTFPVEYLISAPEEVESSYRTHARTHISLGDTAKYVDTIFKWVGGGNRGAFIGAVVGAHGHGKTSFQVHVWDRSQERKVFCVPPFSWSGVSDIVDGIDAWIQHVVGKTYAEVAAKAKRLYVGFRKKSLKEQAEQIASNTKQNPDDVYRTLSAAMEMGDGENALQMSPKRLLDYCDQVTTLLKKTGYSGLLILLDEPELTAKDLGIAKVSKILFSIADNLRIREGDYGVFISMPEKFFSQMLSSLPALPARLQSRNCVPRLRDIYGPDFAQVLWGRYVKEFDLGEYGRRVVSPETLQAIGQVGSSDRSDLSYGPRTVISAFQQMVYSYKEKNTTYSPVEFVGDCMEGTIWVTNYGSLVGDMLKSPEAEGADREVLMTLAAFPNGMTSELAKKLGIDRQLMQLSRRPSLVYKRGNLFGLTRLRKTEGVSEGDELREIIASIMTEFSPHRRNLSLALTAFVDQLIPVVFEPRQGQQLLGWDIPESWQITQDRVLFAEFRGAFQQTYRNYPKRSIMVAIGTLDSDSQKLYSEIQSRDSNPDIIIFFKIRWDTEDPMPKKRIEIDPVKSGGKPGTITLVLDFADDPLSNEFLEEIVDKELLTPLGVLYLLHEKHRQMLPKAFEAEWKPRKEQLVRELIKRFFGDPLVRTQASEQVSQMIPGDALALLGSVCRAILLARYPNYSTLITQPQWEKRLNEYIGALKNTDIPLGCKRGLETWSVSGNSAAKVFSTSPMNLTGGFFAGMDNLITIKTMGRRRDIEVDFKIHPLENAITAKITNDNPYPKHEFDGVECWCLPVKNLSSTVAHLGYLREELQQIAEIGRSRHSFQVREYRGEKLFFCKPLDLDQMKKQLIEKLEDLEEETAEFRQVPRFHSSFDYKRVRRNIDEVQDEVQYDVLGRRINREFEKIHDQLPGYFEQFGNAVSLLRESANGVKRGLVESREAGTIKISQKASSKWCADLNAYVLGSLKDLVKQVENECSSILVGLNRASTDYSVDQHRKPLERVDLLLKGWAYETSLEERLEGTKTKARMTLTSLREYEQWTRLLVKSDEVHSQIIELKKEPAHEAKAAEFYAQLETIWHDISQHLKVRNITGLGSHKQFYVQFEQLAEKRTKYISLLRSGFEEKKNSVNKLLEEIDVGQESRCKETFNQDDTQGCYDRLYEEASTHIMHTASIEVEGIVSQRQELLYARDILSRLSQDVAEPLVAALDSCVQLLKAVQSHTGSGWVLELLDGPKEERSSIKEALKKSREAIRSARRAIPRAKGIQEEKLSPDAEKMLEMIPARTNENLKKLILGMMKSGRGGSEVLNASLDCVAELFRNGKIKVVVERDQR